MNERVNERVFILEKAPITSKKKYIALQIFPRHKRVAFGDNAYEDFTTTNDETKKERYITRHKSREDWNNPETAGFWSKHLLWNKKTVNSSIKDIESRFNIKIIKAF
jgi:hypothetical protein